MKISIFKLVLLITIVTILANCDTHSNEGKEQNSLKQVSNETNKYDSTVFEGVFNKLESGDTLSKIEIEDFSKRLETRADFYELLVEFKKENLFPKEYYTIEKASESVLTNWLLFPTELDTIPSKMELLKKVDYLENATKFTYYVFQFKTEEPHWAAKNGWMIGVVGPYFESSKPYDWTSGTFSKFSKSNETTPEKEVEWVHKNVYERNPEYR